MKKIGLISLSVVAALSQSCDKTIEQLNQEKKDLISQHKADSLTYLKSLKTIDSLIAAHADSSKLRKKVKKIAVTTAKVEVTNFEHFFEVHGNVEAEENAALFAQAPGIVQKILVQEGQVVGKGEVIIQLDASAVESALKELETAYGLANKVYGKQKALWDQKIGSELQFLEAKNNKEGLEQKIKTLKEQIDMYNIKAPFAGVVDEITPKVGEQASPGFPVGRILNMSRVYLEADVSEKYLTTVKTGSYVEIKFPSLNESVKAKVTRAGNYIKSANRTFKVKVEFDNTNGKYKPNQLAVLKIRDYKADSSIVIPAKVIQQDRAGNNYIYTYAADASGNKRVKKVMIEVGKSYEGKTEVLKGLDNKTIFIDKGAKTVQSEDIIEIKN